MITDVEVIDGAFDNNFLEYCEHYYLGRLNFRYGHVSNNQVDAAKFWYGADFDGGWSIDDCPITDYIKTIAQKSFEIKIENYEDLYVNGHTFECPGTTHVDQRIKEVDQQKFTLLFMPNYHDIETLGGFEFLHNTIDYKSGRLILFPANLSHRGLATTSKKQLRMTIAWKNCTITRSST